MNKKLYMKNYRQNHKEQINLKTKKYNEIHPDKVKQWRIDFYNKHPNYQKNRREYMRIYHSKYYKKVRLEVLKYYSKGKLCCNCCGESHIEFLTIDHIESVSKKGIIKKWIRSGQGLYNWLKWNHFPEGYQVLCFNCNMAKSIYGNCPHKTIYDNHKLEKV